MCSHKGQKKENASHHSVLDTPGRASTAISYIDVHWRTDRLFKAFVFSSRFAAIVVLNCAQEEDEFCTEQQQEHTPSQKQKILHKWHSSLLVFFCLEPREELQHSVRLHAVSKSQMCDA